MEGNGYISQLYEYENLTKRLHSCYNSFSFISTKTVMKKIGSISLCTLFILATSVAFTGQDTSNTSHQWYSDKYIICDAEIKDWPRIQQAGIYRPNSLKTIGFIHCARAKQLFYVANTFFKGKSKIFLVIDPKRLTSPIKYEGTLSSNLYPHVYGPINLDAVIWTKEIKPNSNGSYTIPKELIMPFYKN